MVPAALDTQHSVRVELPAGEDMTAAQANADPVQASQPAPAPGPHSSGGHRSGAEPAAEVLQDAHTNHRVPTEPRITAAPGGKPHDVILTYTKHEAKVYLMPGLRSKVYDDGVVEAMDEFRFAAAALQDGCAPLRVVRVLRAAADLARLVGSTSMAAGMARSPLACTVCQTVLNQGMHLATLADAWSKSGGVGLALTGEQLMAAVQTLGGWYMELIDELSAAARRGAVAKLMKAKRQTEMFKQLGGALSVVGAAIGVPTRSISSASLPDVVSSAYDELPVATGEEPDVTSAPTETAEPAVAVPSDGQAGDTAEPVAAASEERDDAASAAVSTNLIDLLDDDMAPAPLLDIDEGSNTNPFATVTDSNQVNNPFAAPAPLAAPAAEGYTTNPFAQVPMEVVVPGAPHNVGPVPQVTGSAVSLPAFSRDPAAAMAGTASTNPFISNSAGYGMNPFLAAATAAAPASGPAHPATFVTITSKPLRPGTGQVFADLVPF